MLFAFLGAGLTNLGADLTKTAGEFRTLRHYGRRAPAGLGACTVKHYAAGHRLEVLFMQAFRGAMLTDDGAFIALIDAFLIFFMGHNYLLGGCLKYGFMGITGRVERSAG